MYSAQILELLWSKEVTEGYRKEDDIVDDDEMANTDYPLETVAADQRSEISWCAPLPVKPRTYSMKPPSLSSKIFLGGIPHDMNEGELSTRLSQFGSVRIVWPGKSGYAYAIFDKEASVYELLLACCEQTQRNSDGRSHYYLHFNSQRSASRRKSVQLIPWFTEDTQWMSPNYHNANMCELLKVDPYKTTVFVGALHGMMTAYALAKIFSKLFGEVGFAAIHTDRNNYPTGTGRVIFTEMKNYWSAIETNFLMIKCEEFCKIIQVDPYLVNNQRCSGVNVNGQLCQEVGKYFCRALTCWQYFCSKCWTKVHTDVNNDHHKLKLKNV